MYPNAPSAGSSPEYSCNFVTNMDITRAVHKAPPVYQMVYASTFPQIHSALICKMYVELEISELLDANEKQQAVQIQLHQKYACGRITQAQWWRRMLTLSRGTARRRRYIGVLCDVPDTLDGMFKRVFDDIQGCQVIDLSPLDRYVGEVNAALAQLNRTLPKRPRKGKKSPAGFVIDLYKHWSV